MTKKLENLRWSGQWNVHLGCIKGCLDYLNINVSDAWLYGATGYAFIMNMRDIIVCGSSPNNWSKQRFRELGDNVGYKSDFVFALDSQEDFGKKRKEAWDFVRESIDLDIPCYGWELGYPGYQVITGYDDTDYYYSGPDDLGKGHKPWQQLGETELTMGMIQMYNVKQGQAADDSKTVKEALEFALEYAEGPEKWVFPHYRAGLAGWNTWIETLGNGTADAEGMAFNSAFWSECRWQATQFLKEARVRLDGRANSLLRDASDQYEIVSQHLEKVAELFPFPYGNEVQDKERCEKAITYLRKARDKEAVGLESLKKIVETL